MGMKSFSVGDEHKEMYDDIMAVLKKHMSKSSPEHVLAITSQIVGKCIAMQDQRKTTKTMAIAIVNANIELGNRQAIEFAFKDIKGSA